MGYVYFIQNSNGHVKIGSSFDPEKRLKQLQTSNSGNLKMVGVIKTDDHRFLERKIHKELRKHRFRGEWFVIPVLVVEGLIKKYSRIDIKELAHGDSGISDLQQVQLDGIYIVPDAKYSTVVIVTSCEYSSGSRYVTEISTGKGFQHNSQYHIDEVPKYWVPIGTEVMPF